VIEQASMSYGCSGGCYESFVPIVWSSLQITFTTQAEWNATADGSLDIDDSAGSRTAAMSDAELATLGFYLADPALIDGLENGFTGCVPAPADVEYTMSLVVADLVYEADVSDCASGPLGNPVDRVIDLLRRY
jgi:hypothetical protein